MLRAYWRPLAFGTLVGLLGIGYWLVGIDAATEGADLDRSITVSGFMQLRGARPPPDDVAVVDITEAFADLRPVIAGREDWELCLTESRTQSIPESGWPRCAIALLLDELSTVGARQVVFDLLFEEPFPGDDQLERAIRNTDNVVLQAWCRDPAAATEQSRPGRNSIVPVTMGCGATLIPPLGRFLSASGGSGPMLLLFRESTVLRNWTFAPPQTGLLSLPPMLPLVALQARAGLETLQTVLTEAGFPPPAATALDTFSLGRLPAGMLNLRARLAGRTDIEASVAAWLAARPRDALSDEQAATVRALLRAYVSSDTYYINYFGPTGTIEVVTARELLSGGGAILRGRTVFVGSTTGGRDTYPTPFARGLADNVPGVEIAATTFANLDAGTTILPLPDLWAWVLLMTTGIIIGAVARLLRPLALSVLAVAAVLYFGMTYFMFADGFILLPVVTPLIVQPFAALVLGVMLRLPPLIPWRQEFNGICLKTDIEDSMKHARRPHFRTEIKRYLHGVERIIGRHGGTFRATAGDATMSYWREGWRAAHRREAICLAAVEINRHFCSGGPLEQGLFPTRIGLHSGLIHTVDLPAGDTIVTEAEGTVPSTAARLETLGKIILETGTLASSDIVRDVKRVQFRRIGPLASSDIVRDVKRVQFRRIGRFQLKGPEAPLEVVELIGEISRLSGDRLAERDAFLAAATLVESGDRAAAEAGLVAFTKRYPDDCVASFLLAVVRDELPNIARLHPGGLIEVRVKEL